METIRFRCPNCAAVLRVSSKHAGSRKKCPQTECGQMITIPKQPADKPRSAKTERSQAAEKSSSRRDSKVVVPTAKKPSRPPRRRSKSSDADFVLPERSSKTGRSRAKTKKKAASKGHSRWVAALAIGGAICTVGVISYLLPSGSTGGLTSEAVQIQAEPTETFATHVQPFLQKYCYDCHGADIQEEGIQLNEYTGEPDFLAEHQLWQKVFQQISVGSMPPQDYEGPSAEERSVVSNWLDQAINHFDCSEVNNPGRVTVHRLNRTEYDNTIRDLLSVDLNLSKDFPTDDVGYGFDNIGDVLSISPLLMERYLTAAEKAAAAAIALPESMVLEQNLGPDAYQLDGAGAVRGDTVSFVSRGSGTTKFQTRVAGKYEFTVTLSATQAADELARCRVSFDGEQIDEHEVPGHRKKKTFKWSQEIQPGEHTLKFEFTNDHYAPDAEDKNMRDRNLYLHHASISGPDSIGPDDYPVSHRAIVKQYPSDGISAEQAARKVLEPLATRAFRRPVTIEEMDRLVQVFQIAQSRDESYERSLQICLQAILVSPQFLFRLEEGPDSPVASQIQTLGDYELASRLSYFLWSSMPDETLLDLASKGLLQDPAVLQQQVRRMLKDPRSESLVRNFVGQWLGLRKLNEVEPDGELFPEFTPELVAAMTRETELLFSDVLDRDASLMELITADYTFVNEPLANLYNIEGVAGDQFQKVSLADKPRRGFISHAGILTLTSFPNRTSPVKRGEWVLENVLAQAPPPAPANVPGLEETQAANPNLSFREQLVLHQKDPICSSCHKLMDGIGFGLQNYDAIGRWRDRDGEFEIDARGDLPDGSSFASPLELIDILGQRPDNFAHCVTEKMLTYALGRGLEWYDKCTVDEIVANVRGDGYRFSRLITEVVLSDPFRTQLIDQ